MTNAIGTGTRNLSVNVPTTEWELIGRAAGPGRLGDFLRRLIIAGAEKQDPALAQKLKEVRRQYYGVAMLLIVVGLVASGDDLLRAARKASRRRNETEAVFVEI